MQTILGAGGAIGTELAKALKTYTNDIRLVARAPKKVNDADQLFPADLTNAEQVSSAVNGSAIVYLAVGLDYKTRIWQETWPLIMQNVISACITHNSRLVFFDNVYMIGGDNVNHITEDSPDSPVSKKGMVRSMIDQMILQEVKKGNLNAIIARSADFYGPYAGKSIMTEMVYKNLQKNKKAQWLCNAKVVHSFTYIPDAATGTAILGNTPDAYNQIWNLPTHNSRLTGEDWIRLFAAEMGKPDKYQVIHAWLVRALGLAMPIMREFGEMLYQYDRDYFFDSSKFQKRFNYEPAAPELGVKTSVEQLSRL